MKSVIQGVFIGLAMTGPIWAQDLPSDDHMADRISAAIPAWWQVTEFRMIASSDVGDISRPRSMVRFEVDASPTASLFAEVDRMPPFVMITETRGVDADRVLYGVMDLRYRAGSWSSSIDIENPVANLGAPRDMFPSPTLVVGSPEAEAAIADLQMMRESRAVSRFERELAALRDEHRAAIMDLQAIQETEIETLRRDHAGRMTTLEQELERELSDLTDGLGPRIATAREEHDQALSMLAEEQAEELATIRAEHERRREALTEALAAETDALEEDLARTREAHGLAVSELAEEHSAELENIRVEHARQRSTLREELNAEIATLEVELEAQIERLQMRLASSQRAQELEAAYQESVEARAAAASDLRDAMQTALSQRVALVQTLPDQYRGGVRCRDADNRIDRSWQLALGFEEASPSGMRGFFGIDRTNRLSGSASATGTVNMVIRSDNLSLPLEARLSFAGSSNYEHLPATVDVTISESVVVSGTETAVWTIDGQSTPVTCVYELS